MQHGAGMTGDVFLGWEADKSLPARLAERGYDVWLGNDRGTPYSNYNVNDDADPAWTDEEHWDFSWADMGKYDIPA